MYREKCVEVNKEHDVKSQGRFLSISRPNILRKNLLRKLKGLTYSGRTYSENLSRYQSLPINVRKSLIYFHSYRCLLAQQKDET